MSKPLKRVLKSLAPAEVSDVLDGVTPGTATASKAVVLGASKEIATITSATITTLTAPTVNATNIDAGASGAAGTVDIFPATASKGKFILSCEDQDGNTNVTLKPAAMGQASVVSIPDPGAATANVMLTSAGNDGVVVAATSAEIDRACDLSARLVALTATDAITVAEHEGRDCYITGTAAATYTLPEATGSGARFRFIIGEVNTNSTIFVVADTTNANFIGSVNILDLDAAAQGGFGAPANCDTITLNGTTTGGQKGDYIELVDVAADVWFVVGQLQVPTGSNPATPFSAAV